MRRLPPTIIVSTLALRALLGCDHGILGDTPSDGVVVEGKKVAAQPPEGASGPVPVASPAAPSKPSEAREALNPQPAPAGDRSPTAGAPTPSSAHASERVPTSGTAAEERAANDKAQDDTAAGREGVDRGSASDTCVQGWVTPRPSSKLRKAALDMLREHRGERFVVLEMRYFVGPEDAEVIGPQRQVERWYVKARSLADRSRQQRWLLRRAAVGSGIDAVAPFDSTGYGPGTWRRPDAVDESTADPFQHPCDTARAGARCMGLPRAVLGCLKGT